MLAILLATMALAGCSSTTDPGVRAIDGAFPPGGLVAELPFRVSDVVGLVQTVSLAQPHAADGVTQVPGRDDAIYVQWMGGMCDREALIVFDRTVDGLGLRITTERDFGGCRMAGISRTLQLDLSEPVDASTVSIVIVD